MAAACGSAFAVDFEILSYPPPVHGGNIQIDLGLGFSAWGDFRWNMMIPPLAATVEYCLPVMVPISVGGMFGFAQFREDSTFNYLAFAGRANWHWGFGIEWLDAYTGVSLGYQYFGNSDWNYSPFYRGAQIGAHFYLTDFIGAVAEIGYPILAKAGIALKF